MGRVARGGEETAAFGFTLTPSALLGALADELRKGEGRRVAYGLLSSAACPSSKFNRESLARSRRR